VRRHGYQCIRIDDIQDSGNITDQVLQEIAKSKFVLADLTGERPNTYYEAGFAHALGKRLILTIRKTARIHFDLAGYRFILWETEQDLRQQLAKRLKAYKLQTKGTTNSSM
jgi:nucleoside 2-deoxyribosyltransferase